MDLGAVNFGLYEGIGEIVANSMLNLKRLVGANRGLELWRTLHHKWRRSSPEVSSIRREQYLSPEPATSLETLHQQLLEWEFLGQQLRDEGAGLISEEYQLIGLKNLCPPDLRRELRMRPDLSSYSRVREWMISVSGAAKTERDRAAARKARGGPSPMDLANLNVETEESCEEDSEVASAMLAALDGGANPAVVAAILKGKGRGKGGKGTGKGGGKGGKGGKGGGTFPGECWRCGKRGTGQRTATFHRYVDIARRRGTWPRSAPLHPLARTDGRRKHRSAG